MKLASLLHEGPIPDGIQHDLEIALDTAVAVDNVATINTIAFEPPLRSDCGGPSGDPPVLLQTFDWMAAIPPAAA